MKKRGRRKRKVQWREKKREGLSYFFFFICFRLFKLSFFIKKIEME